MKKMLVIDSDDISGLSNALIKALARRGVQFRDGDFGYQDINDDEEDIDPFFGVMPNNSYTASCGHSLDGGCGYAPVYRGGCGSGGCGISFSSSRGGCGTGGC